MKPWWTSLELDLRCCKGELFITKGDEAMITSFSTLYAGHVLEGEGIGFDGMPHDDRWYDNDRLAQAFGDAGFSDW
jgi:hypothetical protein